MTYEEFIAAALANQQLHPEWRWGQTLYNTLSYSNLGLIQNLVGTAADCYDRADHIPAFLDHVHRYFESFGSVTDERCRNI